ncbi:MAG TPA: hypothetical protein VN258_06865 [Mobilitalea sp.]|nr:hypothetical protein [Mobilitalea sp.]
MSRTRMMIIAALMAAIAAIFQLLPVLLSEFAVLLTIASALPIYCSSRIKPLAGILSYLVAAFLIMLFSTHEGLFFLCSNGMIGLSLGVCRYYKQKKLNILLISSFCTTLSLSIMNYGIGIPVFGTSLPGNLVMQLSIIYTFLLVYNFIYLLMADSIYKRLEHSEII